MNVRTQKSNFQFVIPLKREKKHRQYFVTVMHRALNAVTSCSASLGGRAQSRHPVPHNQLMKLPIMEVTRGVYHVIRIQPGPYG